MQIIQMLIKIGIEENIFDKKMIEKYLNDLIENDNLTNEKGWPDFFIYVYLNKKDVIDEEKLNMLLIQSLNNYS